MTNSRQPASEHSTWSARTRALLFLSFSVVTAAACGGDGKSSAPAPQEPGGNQVGNTFAAHAQCGVVQDKLRTLLEPHVVASVLANRADAVMRECPNRWPIAVNVCMTAAQDAAAVAACLTSTTMAPGDLAALRPISVDEATAFGETFHQAFVGCAQNPAALGALLDPAALTERVRALVPAGVTVPEFGADLPGFLCAGIDPNPRFTAQPARVLDGSPRPRLRVLSANGINFLEPVLRRNASGGLTAVDIYSHLLGNMVSVAGADGAKLEARPDVAAIGPDYITADDLNRAGDARGAWAAYQRLPMELRRSNAMIGNLGLLIAAKLDDTTYTAELDAYAQAFPNDPRMLNNQVDTYAMRKDYPNLVAAVGKMLDRTGPEPALLAMRAQANRRGGMLDAAKADADAAFAAEATIEETGRAIYDVSVARGEFARAVEGLRAIEATGVELKLLHAYVKKDPAAKAFRASPDYKAWTGGGAAREQSSESRTPIKSTTPTPY